MAAQGGARPDPVELTNLVSRELPKSAAGSPGQDRPQPDQEAVRDTIARFQEAVEQRDIDALGQVVADEEGIVFYGSQAGDKQVGWAAVRQSFMEQFAEVSEMSAEALDSTVSVVGELEWAAYDLRYREVGGGAAGTFDTRWTCVLRHYPDGWKFVHMHHSRGR